MAKESPLEKAQLRKLALEAAKLKSETKEIRQRLARPWYYIRLPVFLQALAGGIIAVAVIVAWFIAFFEPLLSLDVKLREKENKIAQADLKIAQDDLKIAQQKNKETKNALETDLVSLQSQLEDQQTKRNSAEILIKDLQVQNSKRAEEISDLRKKQNISDADRRRLVASSKQAVQNAAKLQEELKKFKAARKASTKQVAAVSDKLMTVKLRDTHWILTCATCGTFTDIYYRLNSNGTYNFKDKEIRMLGGTAGDPWKFRSGKLSLSDVEYRFRKGSTTVADSIGKFKNRKLTQINSLPKRFK